MGDPAGIGPEVALKALAHPSWRRRASVLLVGDAAYLRRLARWLKITWPPCPVWDVVRVPAGVRPGRIQSAAGRAALEALDRALTLVTAGRAEALVTAPVSKAAISRAGRLWTGHTEYLARAFRVPDPVMLFVAGPLRVSLVTTHLPLARVPAAVTPAKVRRVITRTIEALRTDFGLRRPRVAVAALNPHAGESGVLGRQEQAWLGPLVRRLARQLRVPLTGPWPADTVFAQAACGRYDAVVAMYHDQALIPVKLLAGAQAPLHHGVTGQAVNVTLGLPIVRTSPSHGTAFDLVRQRSLADRADPSSMQHALRLAITLARHRVLHGRRPHRG